MKPLNHKRVILSGLISSKVNLDEFLPPLRSQIAKGNGHLVGELIQRRGVSRSKKVGGAGKLDLPLSAQTYISSGKVEELAHLCRELEADSVVFFNDLTAKQIENLEELIGLPVQTTHQPQLSFLLGI